MMLHSMPLVTLMVAGLGLAFIFGMVAHYCKLSPIVGYLFAGVLIGPATPGYSADIKLAHELAELGVILLMFGVGLHFSWSDLLKVKKIAVPGAICQILIATLMGWGLARYVGWSFGAGIIFGLALSIASTVVLLRALENINLLQTEQGQIAVGWLIVEDMVVVVALVVLPIIAGLLNNEAKQTSLLDARLIVPLALTLLELVLFVFIMLVVGKRVIPWLLRITERTKSPELFRLCVLVIALGVAFGAAKIFGVSFALGAFFAGMILSESELSHRAAEETLPLRDAFAVLFFVAMGMLLNPQIIMSHSMLLCATVLIIVFGKSIAAYLIVIAFRYPKYTALTISVSLAQIGEFSFILAELGVKLKILSEETQDIILAGAIISILLNPMLFKLIGRFSKTEQTNKQFIA